METINLNQLTAGESGIYLLGEAPLSGFAIETFPDGSLATQMSLMRGMHDGVMRKRDEQARLIHEMWRDRPASMARSQYYEMQEDGTWAEVEKQHDGKEPT